MSGRFPAPRDGPGWRVAGGGDINALPERDVNPASVHDNVVDAEGSSRSTGKIAVVKCPTAQVAAAVRDAILVSPD
jgi:hypothetical protein